MGSRNYRGHNKMSNGQGHSNADEDHMDQMNRSIAESLSMKVSQLKSIAIDLDGETRDQIPLLEDIGDGMDGSSHRMGGSSGRLRNISRNRGLAGRNLTCCVGLSVTVFLFIVYYLLSRSLSSG